MQRRDLLKVVAVLGAAGLSAQSEPSTAANRDGKAMAYVEARELICAGEISFRSYMTERQAVARSTTVTTIGPVQLRADCSIAAKPLSRRRESRTVSNG
jgi:hypothetical protein